MALRGVRVIDLTRILAGPFCTMLLADMGADVIKVESPKGGDPVRRQGAIRQGFSWYFAQFNRNKRSICLDLYSDDGKKVLERLLTDADVLVENYRPGVLAKMGFTADHLAAINPRLIVTHVTGYGLTGPYHQRPSFDFIAQAMSGFMSVNGAADGPPLRAAPPISDLVAGLYAAFGTVSALYARDGGNHNPAPVGQEVESSLTAGLISMMAYLSAEYFATGETPQRTGNDHPIVAPYGLFNANDGNVAIAPSNDTFVHRLLDALQLSHILQDPDFADNAARMKNRARINALVNEKIGANSVEHWISVLNRAGVPCGRVMDLAQVFSDPQVLAQEMVLDVPHPRIGTLRMTGFPVKLSATPATVRHAPPELGADTNAILSEAGYDTGAIETLAEKRVTGGSDS